MAKQRINVFEAHVEKVVLGLTAAVLLVVAFFYLVQTPNVIEAMGQTYGPGDYDKDVVRTKADNLKAMFNRLDVDYMVPPQITRRTMSLAVKNSPEGLNNS